MEQQEITIHLQIDDRWKICTRYNDTINIYNWLCCNEKRKGRNGGNKKYILGLIEKGEREEGRERGIHSGIGGYRKHKMTDTTKCSER